MGTIPHDAAPKAVLAHMIRNTHGELERISLCDTEASMAETEGHTVTVNATADDIAEEMLPLPASEYMDDKTWTAIAPGLKALADHFEKNPTQYDRWPAIMPPTSPDLPDDLIPARMNALGRMFHAPLDLTAYIELNELAFARAADRPANKDLFKDESWTADWNSIYQEDLETLDQRSIAISEMMSEHASEKAAFGDGPPGSHRKDVLGDLEQQEIDFAIKTYFGPEGENTQSAEPWTDIPY